jgi:hypothetical protein
VFVPESSTSKIAAPAATTASAPPTPPVATTASLSSKCVTGFVTIDPDTGQAAAFSPFPGPSSYPSGTEIKGGYQVTLTNISDVTAETSSFAVVFYSGGAETGSDTQDTGDSFIIPGQSLTWTETTTVMNAGTDGAVDTSATCAMVKWTYP